MFGYLWMVESLNDLIEKTGHNKALGYGNRDTASTKIEKLIFIDLAGRGTMSATHIIGENFETGHRVGFSLVTQEKIANLLIRIGEMRVWLYPDQSAENGAGAIVESVFVQEITRGTGRGMVLQRASIQFLLVFRNRNSEQITAPAFANKTAQTFETRIARAKM